MKKILLLLAMVSILSGQALELDIADITWIAPRGLGVDTGQSEPNASAEPLLNSEPNGYCQLERSSPRIGRVRSTICASITAHSA